MDFPAQKPIMRTLTQETTISNATTLLVHALAGNCTVTGIGSMVIPEGNAIEFTCDKGNTLGDMVITPTTTAQVSYFN